MEDNHDCKAIGIGSVTLKLKDEIHVLLQNVKHVPCLRRNLISMGMPDDQGCSHDGDKRILNIRKGSKIVLTGKKINGLYVLKYVKPPDLALISFTKDSDDELELWHKRLSHISEKRLEELMNQGLIPQKEMKRMNFCEHCVYGKSKKLKFTKGSHTTTKILDYVHGDLWGPSSTPSLSPSISFL